MFKVDLEKVEITMHAGDTGSFKMAAARKSGTAWTSDDRMQMTVTDQGGEIVMQRWYRLDDQYDLGDGKVLIEFHNDDTDEWEPGQYSTEFRFDVSPVWEGTAPTGRCENALAYTGVRMIEGSIVRTVIQSTLTIVGVLGDI